MSIKLDTFIDKINIILYNGTNIFIGGYFNMKKIFSIVLALVLVVSVFTISGCSGMFDYEVVYDKENNISAEIVRADLAKVPGYDYLWYSINTHTVYYLGYSNEYNSWMCPYISNGHYCEYINGKIVEVVES